MEWAKKNTCCFPSIEIRRRKILLLRVMMIRGGGLHYHNHHHHHHHTLPWALFLKKINWFDGSHRRLNEPTIDQPTNRPIIIIFSFHSHPPFLFKKIFTKKNKISQTNVDVPHTHTHHSYIECSFFSSKKKEILMAIIFDDHLITMDDNERRLNETSFLKKRICSCFSFPLSSSPTIIIITLIMSTTTLMLLILLIIIWSSRSSKVKC